MPRLLRFYGGTWRSWMAETPIAVVRAAAAMLPRLDAGEALTAATVAAIGGGTLAPDARRRTLDGWARQATGPRRRRPAPPPSPLHLEALGIGLVPPRRRPGSDDGE